MESIDAKPSVKACVVIRQSEVSCSFWADWSSTIWLNAGCFALNTCMLQGLFFFSFSHAGNTILIVMLSVGEIFLSALACVEVRLLRAVLGCFFFLPGHTNTSSTLPFPPHALFHLFSPLGLSVFTHGLKSESTPEVNWRSSIFEKLGQKQRNSLNAVVSALCCISHVLF